MKLKKMLERTTVSREALIQSVILCQEHQTINGNFIEPKAFAKLVIRAAEILEEDDPTEAIPQTEKTHQKTASTALNQARQRVDEKPQRLSAQQRETASQARAKAQARRLEREVARRSLSLDPMPQEIAAGSEKDRSIAASLAAATLLPPQNR